MDSRQCILWALLCGGVLAGCGDGGRPPGDPCAAADDRQVRARWGKAIDELPTVTIQVVSPHNENILNEFEWAFSRHHAVEFGQNVDIEWRDVGGGSTAVLRYLRNVYARSDSAGIDVVCAWNLHK